MLNLALNILRNGDIRMDDIKEVGDLALASYLYAMGWELMGVVPDGKRMLFVFRLEEGGGDIEKDILAYYNRTAVVNPLGYSEAMRGLKSMIYQKK